MDAVIARLGDVKSGDVLIVRSPNRDMASHFPSGSVFETLAKRGVKDILILFLGENESVESLSAADMALSGWYRGAEGNHGSL